MDRIASIFREGKPLVVFATVGYPSLERSREGLEAAIQNGADILELGVPFSDPMADGPVVANASQRAAEQGVSLEQVLEELLAELREELELVLLLVYLQELAHMMFM